jgi:hypothetical protein
MNKLRGILDFNNHPLAQTVRDFEWEDFISHTNAPFGVPRFETREAALETYHAIPVTSALDCVDSWDILDNIIIPILTTSADAFGLPELTHDPPEITEKFIEDTMLHTFAKLERSVHANPRDVRGTIRFMYEYMRAGIVVRIVKGKIVCFCPFYNPHFQNTWPKNVPHGHERFRTGLPKEKWWANGGILCTEASPWGTHFVMQVKDMIAEAAHSIRIEDAVFCINKRDFPQWKYNPRLDTLVEPYGFLYDKDDRDFHHDVPLAVEPPRSVLPMLSFYGTHSIRFTDVLIPPTEDWEASSKIIYMPSMTRRSPLTLAAVRDLTRVVPSTTEPFTSKKDKLFFRGSATGSGSTEITNQRMLAFRLAQRLEDPRIDVRCVSLSKRLHKHFTESVETIGTVSFPVSQTFYVPMSEQIQNKFLLYIEGHCAACRLGSMLGSGCVVFKTDSTCVASELWFTHLLKENVHYVRIQADLSDLQDKLDYFIKHPSEAARIASNARSFYGEYLSRVNLLSFVGCVLAAVSV